MPRLGGLVRYIEGDRRIEGSLSTLDDRLRSVETGLAKLQAKTDIMATKEGVADLRTEIEKASHEATKNQRNTILVACGVAIAATLSLALWAFQWVVGAG